MTRDGILKMAKQACHPHEKAIFASPWGEEWVLKFFSLIQQHLYYDGIHTCNDECQRPACVAVRKAVEREREACAQICDAKVDAEYATGKVDHNEMGWTQACALSIRARGQS
jgi:hypothetical protein